MSSFFADLGIYTFFIAAAIFIGGILPIFRKWDRSRLPTVISFAAGLMLGSAFFHLFPEAYEGISKEAGIYVLLGFLFLYIIEKFITVHICEIFDCQVHHLGITAFIGIAIHTLFNGIALGSGLFVPGLGFVVFLAVAAHKAPEVFCLTTVLLNSQAPKSKIALVNLLIILMIPVGALVAYLLLRPENTVWIDRALAFSAGIFLHISLSDLLPEAHKHSQSKIKTTLAFVVGLVIMWLLVHRFGIH